MSKADKSVDLHENGGYKNQRGLLSHAEYDMYCPALDKGAHNAHRLNYFEKSCADRKSLGNCGKVKCERLKS
jgi:hypothetical protein